MINLVEVIRWFERSVDEFLSSSKKEEVENAESSRLSGAVR